VGGGDVGGGEVRLTSRAKSEKRKAKSEKRKAKNGRT
jgi:hypothetical protein